MNDYNYSACIANVDKYDSGSDEGVWVDFPIDEQDFNNVLTSIGIGSTDEYGAPYEEWFVVDQYCDLKGFTQDTLGEYPSYDRMNTFGIFVKLAEKDVALRNLFEATGGDFDRADEIGGTGKYKFYPGIKDCDALGGFIIDDLYGGVDKLSKEQLQSYFSFDKLGEELSKLKYETGEQDENGNPVYESASMKFVGREGASNSEIGYSCIQKEGFDNIGYPEDYFDFESFGKDFQTQRDIIFTEDGAIDIME